MKQKKVAPRRNGAKTARAKEPALSDLMRQIEALSKTVSRHWKVIQELHLAMEKAHLTSYWPPVEKPMKAEMTTNIDAIRKGVSQRFGVAGPVVIRAFFLNENLMGYLAEDGTWTLDPKKIKKFLVRQDAQEYARTMTAPGGTQIDIYP
jgi:hypothetical protein